MMQFLLLIYLVVTSLRIISSHNHNNDQYLLQNLQDHCKCHKGPTGPPPIFYRQPKNQPLPIPVPVSFPGFPNMPYLPDLPQDLASYISNAASPFAKETLKSEAIPAMSNQLPIIVLPFYSHGFNPYRNPPYFGINPKQSHKKRFYPYLIKRDDRSLETGNMDNSDDANYSCDPHNSRCKNTQDKKKRTASCHSSN
ncbi:unnamed protein product [Arctia plantaginis]|uniref:Uncharacterized protein n=1 Tax=Arctia plantaginis TaxID=874455 RepID=A0A8S0ZQH6_ARCPL|nr:unnamed protein product [Arctia plantaginis]